MAFLHFRFAISYDYSDDYEYLDYNGTITANESASKHGKTKNRKRIKRDNSAIHKKRNGKTNKKTNLRKTNSASSVLGLNVLLHQDYEDYWNPPGWKGLVQNSYHGFKV